MLKTYVQPGSGGASTLICLAEKSQAVEHSIGLFREGPIRRVAGQPWHLELGR